MTDWAAVHFTEILEALREEALARPRSSREFFGLPSLPQSVPKVKSRVKVRTISEKIFFCTFASLLRRALLRLPYLIVLATHAMPAGESCAFPRCELLLLILNTSL